MQTNSKYIQVAGYYKDEPDKHISGYIFKIGLEVDEDEDENIFYYLEEGEPILGEHGDFVITSFEPTTM